MWELAPWWGRPQGWTVCRQEADLEPLAADRDVGAGLGLLLVFFVAREKPVDLEAAVRKVVAAAERDVDVL